MDIKWIPRAVALPLLGLLMGAALGASAWGQGRVPVLALLLPVLVALSATRSQAFCVGLGYAVAVLRFGAAFIGSWFGDDLLIGSAAVLTYGALSGFVWSLGWSGSIRPLRRAAATILAWLVALLPPAAIGVPGHPLIAMGYLLPGSGWFGLAASALVPAAGVWAAARHGRAPARVTVGAVVGAAALLGAASVALYEKPASSLVRGVQAVSTQWGKLTNPDEALTRMERMGRLQVSPWAVTVVWPESILGRYDPSTYAVLDLEVLRPSRRAGAAHVVGMDIPLPGDRRLHSAGAFYPDGTTATATARQPAPVSLWKTWKSTGTFIANWRSYNMLSLGQGDRAAVIFCYEEYVPALYLLNEAFDEPTVYLAMANTWAARQSGASAVQTWHSLGMAKLFGREYLKAENRPSPPGANWSASVAP
jgi:hypothetical protein